MSKLRIEQIKDKKMIVNVVGTRQVFTIKLDKVIDASVIESFESEHACFIGFLVGVICKANPSLLKKYDMENYLQENAIKIKELRLDSKEGSIFFLDAERNIIHCSFKRVISNQDVIGALDPKKAFYIGFLVSFLLYDKRDIELSQLEYPYLVLS